MTKLSDRQKGIICIILSALFFACMNVCVRLSGDLPAVEKSFFRNFIAALVAAYAMIKNGKGFHIIKGNLLWLILRSFLGTVGILCNFYAVDNLLLADASAIQKLIPFITIVASYFLLSEKLYFKQVLYIILAFLSSLLVIKPTFSNINLYPSLIALLGAFGAGFAYTIVRKLTQSGEEKSMIIFFFSCFSCLSVIPFIAMDFVMPTTTQLLILILAGLFASAGQYSVTFAYGYAPANQISIYDYSQIIMSAILGFLFFAQVPDMLSYIGYVLIISIAIISFKHGAS